MRPLIVPAPHQTDQELAQQIVRLTGQLGLPSSAVATDSGGPRLAYRVEQPIYDAWLREMGINPDAPAQASTTTAAVSVTATAKSTAGAGVEGSAAPAAPSTTTTKKAAKAGKATAS